MSDLRKKASKGLLWSSIDAFGAKGLQFVIGIILARLLTPEDYGLIGMLAIFLAISMSFINSGFSQALIQKKDRDEKDYSTTFYFNIVVAIFFYLVLFFAAPSIANFYDQPILINLTRVIGFTIIINSFAVVQRAKFTINIDFKTQTKASIISVTISGVIGIYLAFTGYGVWSLVTQSMLQAVINVTLLWVYSNWLPKDGFHFDRFEKLFSFGSKLLVSGLLDTIYKNIYLIIIGKAFSAGDLGFYTRAKQFSEFPSSNITGILSRVTFPLLASIQDDDIRLKNTYRKIIKSSVLVVFPLMMGLAALAEPLIRIILTDKWIELVWMLQLLCFAGMWYPVHALNLNVLNVKGRSDLFLKLEVIKKIVTTIILFITVPLGIEAMIIGQIISSYIALIINTYFTKKIIDYGFIDQMSDLIKVLLLSFAMGLIIYYSISFFNLDSIKLIFGFSVGTIFYLGTAWFFNLGEIRSLPSFLNQK